VRIGHGFDSHRLVPGRSLVIGGVRIEHDKGLLGHSDADVLAHAIIDGLLGAMGWGDIGAHFPDTDPAWKDVSSMALLSEVMGRISAAGWDVAWVDTTVVAQAPRLAPFLDEMKRELAAAGLDQSRVNIKAKTAERMGPVGRGEGIEAFAVCLVEERRA